MSYRSATRNTSFNPAQAPITPSTLMVIGSAVRIAYGAGALLAPARMVRAQYAPDTHELPDPRLTLRAFGGHQLVVGCITLATTCSERDARPAATLSLLIDTLDVASALLEMRVRGRADQTVLGGIIISGGGILTFAAARRALARQ